MDPIRSNPTTNRHIGSAASRPVVTLPYRDLLVLFVGSRILIYLTAAFGLLVVGHGPHFRSAHGIADWFLQWDALWYLDVIEHGYKYVPGGSMNVGYFPLYPWIARVLTLGGLIPAILAGYLAALVGLWLAAAALWRLMENEFHDAALATTAVAFLLFNPISLFFSALYSESWFLLLTIGCFVAARQQRWWIAGLLGALAALTRFVGLALVVPLVWEFMTRRITGPGGVSQAGPSTGSPAPSPGLRGWTPLLACLLPIAGYALYCGVMWVKFGNPLMYAEANAESGRHFTWFWDLFARPSFTGLPPFYQLWFAGATLAAFALIAVGVFLRTPTSFAVYALTLSFIYISARFVDSLPRYFAGLFPMYVAAALLTRRWPSLLRPLLACCAALLALSVILFVNGYWFT